jgi:hypothetical protein
MLFSEFHPCSSAIKKMEFVSVLGKIICKKKRGIWVNFVGSLISDLMSMFFGKYYTPFGMHDVGAFNKLFCLKMTGPPGGSTQTQDGVTMSTLLQCERTISTKDASLYPSRCVRGGSFPSWSSVHHYWVREVSLSC